jgi:UDP-N-acetyl-D-mannosaminuronic acid dehydrogenase
MQQEDDGVGLQYDVCVVGLGYVGLPTACALAESGLKVVGVDVKGEVVALVSQGSSPLSEASLVGSVKEQVGRGMLSATTDLAKAVAASRSVIISVQTPLEGGKANLDHLRSAVESVASSIGEGRTVVVESTVPPGTCERVLLPIFERHGRFDGSGFYFAYCPERIAPGDSLREFVDNDRIIGANHESSRERGSAVMKPAVRGKLLPTDVRTAETTKLVENAARDAYIGFANDLAKICARVGVDVREVVELANTHPRVKILNPGPGVGGPCLTKDPYFLLEGLEGKDGGVGAMIRTARSVNDGMKDEVLAMVEAGGGLGPAAKVAVLGTAYKPEVDDPRSSPSGPIISSLLEKGYEVRAYDPLCKEGFGARMTRTLEEATTGADCVLILVAHHQFKALSLESMVARMSRDPLVVDAVGVTASRTSAGRFRLRRLGDGRLSKAKETS